MLFQKFNFKLRFKNHEAALSNSLFGIVCQMERNLNTWKSELNVRIRIFISDWYHLVLFIYHSELDIYISMVFDIIIYEFCLHSFVITFTDFVLCVSVLIAVCSRNSDWPSTIVGSELQMQFDIFDLSELQT